jgi:hypothetical protein
MHALFPERTKPNEHPNRKDASMKTGSLVALVATIAVTPLPAEEQNQEHRFGAGLMLGEPIGANLKYWFTDKLAIDGALGRSFRHDNDFYLHSDVLYHLDLIDVDKGRLPLYFGGGLRARWDDDRDTRAGVRVPVGITYIFEDIPVDVFFELAPVFDFTPKYKTDFTVGIGARYWF